MGTLQMLAGLTYLESEIEEVYQRVLLQAPCIIVDDISTPNVAPDAPDFIGFFRGELDPPIYSLPSDDWETD